MEFNKILLQCIILNDMCPSNNTNPSNYKTQHHIAFFVRTSPPIEFIIFDITIRELVYN
jgi:hypothetical protein